MGVQKGKDSLRDEMEAFLRRRSAQIHDILTEYAVPQLEMMFTAKEAD